MATSTQNRHMPMAARGSLILSQDELAGTSDDVLSVFRNVIEYGIAKARQSTDIGTWHDLAVLEAVVSDEMRDRWADVESKRAEG